MSAQASPINLLRSVMANRSLIYHMTKREVLGRYRGSVLGVLWSFITPLVMLSVYTYIFSVVFQARWGNVGDSRVEFALILFCGLIAFNVFAECVNRAPTLILSNAIYVKKVVFPLEILPVVAICSALIHAACSFLVLFLAIAILKVQIFWTMLLVPVVFLPIILLTLGLSWFLSSLGVFLRDIGVAIGLVTTVVLFMSPIFYPADSVPQSLKFIIELNPLGVVIDQLRGVVLWGRMPNWLVWATWLVASFCIASLGFAWFQKTRKGFADVI